MAEWRLWGGWSTAALRARLEALAAKTPNLDAVEEEMTGDRGWHHYQSDAVIARGTDVDARFARAKTALATYQFSDPSIVVAHFDPEAPLHLRRLLLEIKVWGLRYLCPAVVSRVRDEADLFAFRYDTLDGHIEQGLEWFVLTKEASGDIRFRIEGRWMRGEFPNWWSRVGFMLLGGFYQRRWHRRAHQRLSPLAHFGSPHRPRRDAFGLTHQGVDVTSLITANGHDSYDRRNPATNSRAGHRHRYAEHDRVGHARCAARRCAEVSHRAARRRRDDG